MDRGSFPQEKQGGMMSLVQKAKARQTVGTPLDGPVVWAFAVLPQSRIVAAAKDDSRIAFIDPALSVRIRTYESEDRYGDPVDLTALAALPDGGLLGANFNSVRRFALEEDQLVEIRCWDLLSEKSTSNSVSIAADPSGRIKAAVAHDYLHLLRDDGSTLSVCEEANYFWGSAASPDGKRIAAGRADGNVELRSAADLSVEQTLPGLSAVVLAMAFSPDGKYLAAADDKAAVAVWNLETQDAVTIPGWTKIIGLFWFSDSSGFAAVGLSRALFFFDLDTLREQPAFFTLDQFNPLYVQRAVLRDDETLFVFVEQNGIAPIRLGS
jgi:WD40 repeat protein